MRASQLLQRVHQARMLRSPRRPRIAAITQTCMSEGRGRPTESCCPTSSHPRSSCSGHMCRLSGRGQEASLLETRESLTLRPPAHDTEADRLSPVMPICRWKGCSFCFETAWKAYEAGRTYWCEALCHDT